MARKKTTLKADPEPIDEVKTIEAPEPEDGAILARALGLRGPQDDDHAIKTFRFITQAITTAGTGGAVTISTPAPVQSFYIPEKTFRHLDELEVAITAVQSGSGDPAPDNVRPITGWSEAKIYVQETVDPTAPPTVTIDLDGTRYGCTLDVRRGKLTVDMAMVDMGTLTWTKGSAGIGDVFTSTLSDAKPVSLNTNTFRGISSALKLVSRATMNSPLNENVVALNTLSTLLVHSTTTYADATAFKTAMNGVQLVYELATPIEVDLTPTTIDLLEGQNNIFCDTGDVTRLSYSYENMI